MKAISLANEVERLGGTVMLSAVSREESSDIKLTGLLNGYNIEMHGDDSDFFTVRHQSRRNYFDGGSDYNCGGHTFVTRIKDLARYCKLEVAS